MNSKIISIKKQKLNKNKNTNLSEQQLLKEGIEDTLNLLKKYRSKYETPISKKMFWEITQINNTDISNLPILIKIFEKYHPNVSLTENYKNSILSWSKEIYEKIYKLLTLEYIDTKITSEKTIILKKESFLLTSIYMYISFMLNDIDEASELYVEFLNKLTKVDQKIKIGSISLLIATILMLIKFATNSWFIGAGSILFFTASICLVVINELNILKNRFNVFQTGDFEEENN